MRDNSFIEELLGPGTKPLDVKTVNIPARRTIPPSAFNGCSNLYKVNFQDEITRIERNAFMWCFKLHQIDIPDGLQSIYPQAFAASGLKKIVIPKTCYEIKEKAFAECKDLEEVIFPSDNKIMDLGEAIFDGCKSLKKVIFEGETTVDVLRYNAFVNCKSLEEIILPEGLETIEDSAFSDCTSLQKVIFPKSLEYVSPCAFEGCSDITFKLTRQQFKDFHFLFDDNKTFRYEIADITLEDIIEDSKTLKELNDRLKSLNNIEENQLL